MNVAPTTPFRKAAKKLNKNQKQDLDRAVQAIVNDPAIYREFLFINSR